MREAGGRLQVRPRDQVLFHRQRGEQAAPLRHLHHALAHDGRCQRLFDGLTVQQDRALLDLAVFGIQHARHGLEHRRLARAVGAQQGHDLTWPDFQRHVTHGFDGSAVNHLDVVDGKRGLRWVA
ncbi:hypothetical protein FQZ97_840940 [compost metagenome]